MRGLKDKTHERVWQSNIVDCEWIQGGKLDIGQKVNKELINDNDILLTMDDLTYHPTQKELTEYTFYAKKDVYDQIFKPKYTLLSIKKNKVVGSELKLVLLD